MTTLAIPPDLRVSGWGDVLPASQILAFPDCLEATHDGDIRLGGLSGVDFAGCAFIFGIGWHKDMAGRGYEDVNRMAAVLGGRLAGQKPDWPGAEAHVRGLPVVDFRFEYVVTPERLAIVEHEGGGVLSALEVIAAGLPGDASHVRERILEMAAQARACESGQCSCGDGDG